MFSKTKHKQSFLEDPYTVTGGDAQRGAAKGLQFCKRFRKGSHFWTHLHQKPQGFALLAQACKGFALLAKTCKGLALLAETCKGFAPPGTCLPKLIQKVEPFK